MENLVLYFSRSGNCERIAGKIAGKLGCSSARVSDNVSWKGFFGFMKGGFYSLQGKLTETSVEGQPDLSKFSNIIMIAPLWAGGIAPAAYSLLLKEKESISSLTLVISCDGSNPEKAYARLDEMSVKADNKYCIAKNLKNEEEIISTVTREIGEV